MVRGSLSTPKANQSQMLTSGECQVLLAGPAVTHVLQCAMHRRGEYTLLYFGFTFCPDICPNELVKMGRVIDLLDAQPELPRVRPIFITVDPYRDTVEQMDAYAKDFHPRTEALTGTPDQVGRATRAFRVYFSNVDHRDEDDDDYVVDHSIVMYLMDRQGEFLKFYPQMSEAPEIAESIAEQMREQLGLAKGGSFLSRLFS